MELVAESGLLDSLEIVEVNPILDRENETARLAVELAASRAGRSDPLSRCSPERAAERTGATRRSVRSDRARSFRSRRTVGTPTRALLRVRLDAGLGGRGRVLDVYARVNLIRALVGFLAASARLVVRLRPFSSSGR